MPIAFFWVIPLIWAEKQTEINFKNLGIFSLLAYPIAFKVFIAPL